MTTTAADLPALRPRDVVAGNLRAEMARQKVTQSQLAAAVGWTQRAVQVRAAGEVTIDVEDVVKLAFALEVFPSKLLAGIDEVLPENAR